MKSIKVLGCLAIAMFILWLSFWMFGSWYVQNSFKLFSYVWLGICVAVLVRINIALTKYHKRA